ncbi:MAG: nucleoside monophosphate kinase, partial [Clostridia bacterium]|nr:nucleoside monophosphate kinase [Clostridia bacterium]
ISTGAIIRQAIADGTELGMSAKSSTEKGNLVPDAVVIDIIKERLAKPDCQNGFILDGFPRTLPQAKALDELGVEITDVISLEVDDEAIMCRMSGRRVCKTCGATYHTVFNPSPKGEACGVCGNELIVRKDDKPEVVKDRLRVYHEQTEPLKAFYEAKGLLKLVFGQEKIEETTALTVQALEA